MLGPGSLANLIEELGPRADELRAHGREGTWAWVIGIATSMVAIACARLILRPLGF